MVVGDADLGVGLALPQGHHDVEDQRGVGQLHLGLHLLHEAADLLLLRLADLSDDLQLLVRVAGHHAGHRGRRDAPQPAGVGHHHAFHVLDDVAAGLHQDPVGQLAQVLPGDGGAVGDGDGLGAAHGGQELLLEDGDAVLIRLVGTVHGKSPLTILMSDVISRGKGAAQGRSVKSIPIYQIRIKCQYFFCGPAVEKQRKPGARGAICKVNWDRLRPLPPPGAGGGIGP